MVTSFSAGSVADADMDSPAAPRATLPTALLAGAGADAECERGGLSPLDISGVKRKSVGHRITATIHFRLEIAAGKRAAVGRTILSVYSIEWNKIVRPTRSTPPGS